MSKLHLDRSGGFELRRGRFAAFDELAEASQGWSLDFRQLDAGLSPSGWVQVRDSGTLIQRLRLGRQYEQRGETPPGMLSFGFLEGGVNGVRWCGRGFADEQVFVRGPARDFEAISFPGFGGFTLSFSEARLEQVAEVLGLSGRWLEGLDDGPLNVDPVAVRALQRRLGRVVGQLEGDSTVLEAAAVRHELAFEIPAQLIETLASAREKPEIPPSSVRDLAVRRALQLIDGQPDQPHTVQAICQAARVSRRTLDYAFREHFGVTPKAYLKAVRLNGVRRELRDAEAGTVIADVANRWGFWHMGQVAADYRRLFGELPSQTLKRSLIPIEQSGERT